MRRAIRRAALVRAASRGADLRALGEELDVPELRNLADIAEVAADGAAVYNTLLATARTLRHAELSDARAEANEVSERMSRPLALLVFGLTAVRPRPVHAPHVRGYLLSSTPRTTEQHHSAKGNRHMSHHTSRAHAADAPGSPRRLTLDSASPLAAWLRGEPAVDDRGSDSIGEGLHGHPGDHHRHRRDVAAAVAFVATKTALFK